MANRDLLSSLVCMGLGTIFCIGAIRYGLGSSGFPGPGFLPAIESIILIYLSFKLLISSLKKVKSLNIKVENFFPEKHSMKRTLLSLFAISAYGIILEYLGFMLTTFLFMIFALRYVEELQSRKTIFIAAFLSTSLFYILFVLLLKSYLPEGLVIVGIRR